MSTRPPIITEAEKPLRRTVALAYRSARQAGVPHHESYRAALRAYLEERPDEAADPSKASANVMGMICSAVNVDPAWFWRGVPVGPMRGT